MYIETLSTHLDRVVNRLNVSVARQLNHPSLQTQHKCNGAALLHGCRSPGLNPLESFRRQVSYALHGALGDMLACLCFLSDFHMQHGEMHMCTVHCKVVAINNNVIPGERKSFLFAAKLGLCVHS